jgi:hypothetical protein
MKLLTIKKTHIAIVIIVALVGSIAACNSQKINQNTSAQKILNPLESGFLTPPDSIQTSVYWYWMSDNISKEGVVKDLMAMKSVGINRAFIGNIGHPSTPYGKVKIFSDEWWDILHTALKTATELNIEIGIFNSPGWSQSGGPWIKPEQAMRYLASSEALVTGPKKLSLKLEKPVNPFQDVKVIAFKAPEEYGSSLALLNPKITSSTPINGINKLIDNDKTTTVSLPVGKPFTIDFETSKAFTVRSITIYPAKVKVYANAELLVKENGEYRSLKKFNIDRRNLNLNVGFDPSAPVVVSIQATTSKNYRLVFTQSVPKLPADIAEIEISSSPKIESFPEKTLAKMYHSPLPYWNEYQWPLQPEVSEKELMILNNETQDISKYMALDGTLNWDVPPGNWIIMRTGMTPTGVTNGPASPEATGLEVDKMSKEHIASHFDAFLGEILRRIPAADRKTWKITVEDSYETGGQNWTDGMLEKFNENYGYDALPYLPVLKGKVVGSPEISDRFLWDLRRFIADRVSYDYVAGLREVSHKNGLTTWLENYGHWGFPGEFLQYGGQSDEVAGEFWSEGELGNIENRAASSAAHIYGKTKVSAESFTAGGKGYQRYPYLMKQRGDRFFTEGINNTLLHLFIQQPSDEKLPGISAGFGNEFNRHNTWFSYMDLFIAYLKRSNFMLQQGKYVADVAYFIGEDAPKMTGVTDPELPKGYSFDYINAEVIKRITKVENGRIFLADGMNYGILVLPKLETMRPELLQKISDLVAQGATILGPAPKRSPSLEGYPVADQKVKQLASTLWGNINSTTIKSHKFGKGLVLSGMDMQTALNTVDIITDLNVEANDPVLFIHRRITECDVYFLSNQSEKTIAINPQFRVSGKQPEIWDPITGSIRLLPQFTQRETVTTVPLKLEPLQSAFIVFRKSAKTGLTNASNFPVPNLIQTITSPWEVSFDTKMRGPAKPVVFSNLVDWTQRPEENIKYYSGTAVYKNSFKLSKPALNQQIFMNLGDVKVMAKLRINGINVGGVWTAPWQVNITNFVKSGSNSIEISVVNTWVNRLIGDSMLPVSERRTWTSVNIYKPESPLEISGLKGPVTITSVIY